MCQEIATLTQLDKFAGRPDPTRTITVHTGWVNMTHWLTRLVGSTQSVRHVMSRNDPFDPPKTHTKKQYINVPVKQVSNTLQH